MPLEYRVRLEYSCLFPNTRSVLWRKTAIDAQALAPPSITFLKPIRNLKYEYNTIDPRFVHFFFKLRNESIDLKILVTVEATCIPRH